MGSGSVGDTASKVIDIDIETESGRVTTGMSDEDGGGC